MKIEMSLAKMYGDYKCSCGCGKKLVGTVIVFSEESDEEGYFWRSFTPDCAREALIRTGSYTKLYEKYPVAPEV